MPDFGPEQFLNTPIYALNFQSMVSDIVDFLDFSEANIEWQYRRELHAIRRRSETEELPYGYGEHLEENARHRFEVSLPLLVRYQALLALIASVELSMRPFENQLKELMSTKPGDRNEIVHILYELKHRDGVGRERQIKDYTALVHVRNCIARCSGILDRYKYKDSLPAEIERLNGFSLENLHFYGKHIYIKKDALLPYIYSTKSHIVEIHKTLNG